MHVDGSLLFAIINKYCEDKSCTHIDPTSNEALTEKNTSLAYFREQIIYKVSAKKNHATVQNFPNRITYVRDERHIKLSVYFFSERFGIGHKCSKTTFRFRTWHGINLVILPIYIRHQLDRYHEVKLLHGKFYTNRLW